MAPEIFEATQEPSTAVVLVGCCREKGSGPARARDLYRSARFRLAVEWAEASGSPWFIVSGRHGLVAPDEVLAPYDFDLGSAAAVEVSEWARRVAETLLNRVSGLRSTIILACDTYAVPVAACLSRAGVRSELPLAGLGSESRLRRLADMARRLDRSPQAGGQSDLPANGPGSGS